MSGGEPSRFGAYDETYRGLIDAVVDYAIFRLSSTGEIETWSSGAERIKGYSATEANGRYFGLFYAEEDRQAGLPEQALHDAAQTGRFEGEGWRVRKDGSRFWAHVVIDAIRDQGGQVVGFASITRDATSRDELERAREQLAKAQRLEIVSELTGGIAHDFNNILTAVLGCLDLVAQSSPDERIRKIAENGTIAAARGQRLVSQLLSFARKQILKPERTNVNALIVTLGPLMEKALGEAILLTLELDTTIANAEIDPDQFQSAILNLVLNARDAMPTGGHLTIRTRTVEATAADGSSQAIAIDIEDDGAGMSAEVCARAIEPFFTTKGVGKGSGLGLSQAHGFAAQSGGEMAIRSAPGEGTRVTLRLPAVGKSQVAAAARRRVLVVEDDPEVLTIAVSMLRTRDLEIFAAEDADKALEALHRDAPIDVLFTDIVMPGQLDGIELAGEARRLYPDLEVVLTSGYPREALQDKHRLDDTIGYLSKPYRLHALNVAIDEALQRRRRDGFDRPVREERGRR